MNMSEFDGSAAFYGGGFMPPASNPTREPSFFPTKNRDTQTLLPVTLKQIHDAIPGESSRFDFCIDGIELSTIKVVGIVQDFVGRCTDVTFTLYDGTGKIECTRWCPEQIDTAEVEQLKNGVYVRVHGRLKTFQGNKTIDVFCVRPVDDYNEIASHFIECIYVHSYNNKLTKPQGGACVTTQPYMTVPPNQKPQVIVGAPTHPYMTIPPNQVSGQYNLDAQRVIEQRILQVLHRPLYLSSEKGANVEDIARELKVPVKDIMVAANSLQDGGGIYNTIDEYHYKALTNG